MAWSKVWYDTGRQDQVTSTAQVDDKGNVSSTTQQYIQTYLAFDDGAGGLPPTYSALSAVDPTTALAVPSAGDSATIDGQAGFIVTRVMPKRSTQNPLLFEIQIEYTFKSITQPEGKTKWNLDISVKGQKTTQEAYQDNAGNDIVNAAGEPFDPSVQETNYDEVIDVSYNTTSPPDLSTMRGYVNSGSITFTLEGLSRTFAERVLLLDEAEMSTTLTLSDATTPVWKVSLVFVVRVDMFQDNILDRGYNQLVTIGGVSQLVSCRDFRTGQPLGSAALLNADGTQQAPGGTPHYQTYKIEPEVDLSSLFTGF